jgi:lipopolysaccharide transport system ATP-binding protein
MSDIAIRCTGLSKQYRIGQQERYRALRDVVTEAAAAPLRRLRHAISGNGHRALPFAPGSLRSNTIWALDDVSFEIKPGEVVGIIGRNGAGKSTLLKILSRITKPTKGTAEIHGRVGSLLEVGTGFHPELTGRENIYLNGAILGMRKAEIDLKFDEIVAFAEVEKFIDTPVKRYSSGMHVRLAFAVAAHMQSEILLVDEVLAVGDAAFQRKCLGKMGEVARGGRTVLLVSHNMGALRGLCTEVAWIDKGRIVRTGPPGVIDQYMGTMNQHATSTIELDCLDRAGGVPDRLRLKRVRFNNGAPIIHGESLRACIEFETSSKIEAVAFGFGFSSLEGTRLMTVDSDLVDARRDFPINYCGSVEAVLPQLHLQPGRYLLDIAARSGANSSLDYLAGCAQIEVEPGPATPPSIMVPVGGVRTPASWDWSNRPEPEREYLTV